MNKAINTITNITRYIGLATLMFMMFFIAVAVVGRAFHRPIVGDVELVQLGMVVLISSGIAYTEKVNGHISIGLLVDKLSKNVQFILNKITYLMGMIICLLFSYIYINVFIDHLTNKKLTTDLLTIPYYPFDLLISLGFFLWALQLFLKFINRNESSKEDVDD